ncbi:unnamed protein product [Notodromas monacha]|uniref:Uncharacterized protein n=1 Tax=Notodromas monacha TaxID=399045 RepID=A0A7R9GGR2_9CRUS|nr:unnamed protein product [Notodromas monacha]CAG0920485.1 unnamed protein product [Notodromas monacha]
MKFCTTGKNNSRERPHTKRVLADHMISLPRNIYGRTFIRMDSAESQVKRKGHCSCVSVDAYGATNGRIGRMTAGTSGTGTVFGPYVSGSDECELLVYTLSQPEKSQRCTFRRFRLSMYSAPIGPFPLMSGELGGGDPLSTGVPLPFRLGKILHYLVLGGNVSVTREIIVFHDWFCPGGTAWILAERKPEGLEFLGLMLRPGLVLDPAESGGELIFGDLASTSLMHCWSSTAPPILQNLPIFVKEKKTTACHQLYIRLIPQLLPHDEGDVKKSSHYKGIPRNYSFEEDIQFSFVSPFFLS